MHLFRAVFACFRGEALACLFWWDSLLGAGLRLVTPSARLHLFDQTFSGSLHPGDPPSQKALWTLLAPTPNTF